MMNEYLVGFYLTVYIIVAAGSILAYLLILRRLDPSTRAKWYPRLLVLTFLALAIPLVLLALPLWLRISILGPYEVPEPPEAWSRHKQLVYEVNALPRTACQPVAPIGIIKATSGFSADGLEGTYALTVVANPRVTVDTVSYGYLWLEVADERHRNIQPGLSFPLYGGTSVDLEGLGEADFLYRLTSGDQDLPGVQVHYTEPDGELTLILGAAASKDAAWLDTGVIFTVQQIDTSGFYGSWTGGGLRSGASGYYCARRFQSDSLNLTAR